MQKICAKMQNLRITDAIKNGTMREEDMDTDAISYVSNQDTSTIARVKIVYLMLLGLTPNEATKHEADAAVVAAKIKEDGVTAAAAVDTHEDKATAATAKLLRDLRNKNEVITEEGDANNNENEDAANDSELLKSLKIEDENTPSPNLVREPTTGNSRPMEPKWIVSYPKRWQNPPPLAELSKPSHPLHGAWQRWAPSHGLAVKNSLETNVEGATAAAHTKQLENHKPNGQDEGKSTAVQEDMIRLNLS